MRMQQILTFAAAAVFVCLAAPYAAAVSLPTSIPNSVLWLDAKQIPVQGNDTDLTTWPDQSAVGTNDATGTGAQRPNYITSGFNAMPVVRFTSANSDFMDLPDMTGSLSNNYTVFVAYSFTDKAPSPESDENDRLLHIQDADSGGVDNAFQLNSDGANQVMAIRVRRGNADVVGSSTNGLRYGTRAEGAPEVFTAIIDTSSQTVHREGALTPAGAPVGSGLTTSLSSTIGRRGDNVASTFLNGDIAEILMYDRALNSAERSVIENYLNAKYNLDNDGAQTFGNDQYDGDLAANGNYDLDVLGIGRVDLSNELSSSSSAGLSIAEDNDSLDDDEWLLAGHREETNALVAEGNGERWQRVWQLDKSDAAAVDATLTFDFSDAGLAFPVDDGSFALLFSPSDPFTFAQIAAPSMISGDQVFFNVSNALLLNGFYTLGFQAVPEPSTFALLALGACALRRQRRRGRLA